MYIEIYLNSVAKTGGDTHSIDTVFSPLQKSKFCSKILVFKDHKDHARYIIMHDNDAEIKD